MIRGAEDPARLEKETPKWAEEKEEKAHSCSALVTEATWSGGAVAEVLLAQNLNASRFFWDSDVAVPCPALAVWRSG